LLLALLRARSDPLSASEGLRTLDARGRAALLVELRRHGLSGWAHRFCSDRVIALPPDLGEPLRADHARNIARAVVALSTYEQLSHLLSRAGVEHLPLKGARLLESVYPDPGTREVSDLDVLVHARDLGAADEALTRAGFAGATSRQQTHDARYGVHLQYRRVGPGAPVKLDLHWRLSYRFALRRPADDVWQATSVARRPTSPGERVFDKAGELLSLLVHLADHWSDFRLKWLLDLRLVLEREVEDRAPSAAGPGPQAPWATRTATLARDWGVLALSYHGLCLAHRASDSVAVATARDAVGLHLSAVRRAALNLSAVPGSFVGDSRCLNGRGAVHLAGLWLADSPQRAVWMASRLAVAKLHAERLLA
jgi:hypothetical protein